MWCVSIILGSFLLADHRVVGSSRKDDYYTITPVYQNRCNGSLDCAIYPNLRQGPELIWLPYFCNEEGICGCPNGWLPDFENNVCVTRVSDSPFCSCTANFWAFSLLLVTFLAILVYSLVYLLSGRYGYGYGR